MLAFIHLFQQRCIEPFMKSKNAFKPGLKLVPVQLPKAGGNPNIYRSPTLGSERFLAIETFAERSGSAPYFAALGDKAPWIRDIALYRLTSSDACSASPSCAERFSDVVKRQLQSSTPNERQQAVGWLVWVDSVSRLESERRGFSGGMPVLPDSAIRSLFDAATQTALERAFDSWLS
jgi:hypothetical protein